MLKVTVCEQIESQTYQRTINKKQQASVFHRHNPAEFKVIYFRAGYRVIELLSSPVDVTRRHIHITL